MDEPLRDSRTLAVQLRDRIADLIREEGLKPGDKLPTEAQLTQRFKISRPALREALKLLEQDDVIFVEHGRGRFVSALSAVQVDRPITVFESVTDMAHHYGYRTVNKVLSISEEAPDKRVAESLRLGPADRVIRIERIRLHDDQPILYCIDYVPRSLVAGRRWNLKLHTGIDIRLPETETGAALKRLVQSGALLHPYPAEVMDAALKASNELYAEISKDNADFKKVHDAMMAFRNDQYLWWQIAEFGYDAYMIRSRSKG